MHAFTLNRIREILCRLLLQYSQDSICRKAIRGPFVSSYVVNGIMREARERERDETKEPRDFFSPTYFTFPRD